MAAPKGVPIPGKRSTYFATARDGDVTVVQFLEPRILDPGAINALGKELQDLLDAVNPIKVVLNFQHVDFMVSSFLGEVIALHDEVAKRKGSMRLCCVKSQIVEILRLTKLDVLFSIYPDQASAVRSIKG